MPPIPTSFVNSTHKPVGADEGDEGEEVLLSDDAAVLAKLKESIQNPGVANRSLETNVVYFLRLYVTVGVKWGYENLKHALGTVAYHDS